MKNPKIKIKIETFSWNDFYTKWTTGLANGNVPDFSTALPNHVMEMINSNLNCSTERCHWYNWLKERFNQTALDEAKVEGNYYSVHFIYAQVMWVRKDLLKEHNLEVPKTWEDLYQVSKK